MELPTASQTSLRFVVAYKAVEACAQAPQQPGRIGNCRRAVAVLGDAGDLRNVGDGAQAAEAAKVSHVASDTSIFAFLHRVPLLSEELARLGARAPASWLIAWSRPRRCTCGDHRGVYPGVGAQHSTVWTAPRRGRSRVSISTSIDELDDAGTEPLGLLACVAKGPADR